MANTTKKNKTKPKTTKTVAKVAKPRASVKRAIAKATSPLAPEPHLTSRPNGFDLSALKFELAPPAPMPTPEPAYEYLGELPDAYGTKKLFLVSRDPQWAFAYWDLTWQQFQDAARASHDGKIFLQIYASNGDRIQQIQIGEGSRNWYMHVNRPGEKIYAEIGYYRHDGGFEIVSRSLPVEIPRESVSWKTDARFVTIPFHYSFAELRALIRSHMNDGEGLAEALTRLQESGFEFPFKIGKGKSLTEGQQEALMQYMAEGEIARRIQMGSAEITEILRRRFEEMQSSGQWMSSQWVTSLSSPFGGGGAERSRQFHMHVNAELIIYGGTEASARVQIDGKKIQLREDGTFSYHFALPDGQFFIPIEATSADGVETRSAMLSFMRMTDTTGDVRKTGQPPLPEPIGRVG